MALKDDLFALSLATKVVDIPELQKSLIVKELTGRDRDKINKLAKKADDEIDSDKFSYLLVLYCTYDIEGNRVFEDADLDKLTDLPGGLLHKLRSECIDINKLGSKNYEEMVKNLSDTETKEPG
jgi:hypothetical protein